MDSKDGEGYYENTTVVTEEVVETVIEETTLAEDGGYQNEATTDQQGSSPRFLDEEQHVSSQLMEAKSHREPVSGECPVCHKHITTVVAEANGDKICISSLVLCIFCCPLMWIPFCVGDCHDIVHHCPECNSILGRCKA